MTDKTKEAIAEVLEDYQCGRVELTGQALAKICAIVDEERGREVVLWGGKMVEDSGFKKTKAIVDIPKEVLGKKGRLIFVPEGEK